MLTMRCERCGEEKPLEHFEVGLQRTPLHSHEMQALDRLRREPEQICRDCFQPSRAAAIVDTLLADEDPVDGRSDLDLLANIVDWFRRLGRSRD